ncbi:MAG: D-tyrosyl-tRNA(Tyr) deacylase [Nitrospiraceae bacterium]|nr:D-tyrosyl-tRNA(Tyr) deacylase [Nitrospiraceae bacterium]
MRAVVQRASQASVSVDGEVVGRIGRGLVVFLGVGGDDGEKDAVFISDKVALLRCFEDGDGKFNRSVLDVGGGILLISQFTVHGDCRKGRRPSFTAAARPELAVPLYEHVGDLLRGKGLVVETGRFGAHMNVEVANDGPVTLLVDSKRVF